MTIHTSFSSSRSSFFCVISLIGVLLMASCARSTPAHTTPAQPATAAQASQAAASHALIPLPVSVALTPGQAYAVGPQTAIYVAPGSEDLQRVGRFLADLMSHSTEKPIEVRQAATPPASAGIALVVDAASALGDEGYTLAVAPDGIRITGRTPAGVFYGVQTLRQLMPSSIEYTATQPHAVSIPAARIEDRPRFAWRGAMLDVARHFFGPADVRRYIDLMALYKMNRLHLHLSDDQGWRLEINVVAEPHDARRQHEVRRRPRRVLHADRITRISSRMRVTVSSWSSPRSTCPATSTRRSHQCPS